MFEDEEEHKLPLDTELIRWYILRRLENLSPERWAEYTVDINTRLRNNIDETMEFLETCDDEELNGLCDIVGELMYDVKGEQSEEDYNRFVTFLEELASDHPKSGLKKNLEYAIKAMKEGY